MTRSILAACVLVLTGSAAAEAGVKEDINRAFGQFNRDLCRTLDLKGCRRPAGTAVKTGSKKKAAAPKAVAPQNAGADREAIPIPRRKPQPPESLTVAAAGEAGGPPAEHIIPVPRAKPLVPAARNEANGSAPPAKDAKVAAITPVLPAPKSVTEQSLSPDADCQSRLSRLAVSFTPKPTFATSGSCSLTDPVLLTAMALDDGKVVFPDQPVLNCAFAESFVKWVREKGDPAARREAKSGLSVIYTGPGYECRGRNGDGSAKLSEHGYGNAVDITRFKLTDGRTFEVAEALNPVSSAYATLKSMRFTGCERFSTVLGPGANAAHADHFHFDNGRHGKTGTYRICE